MNAFVLTMFWLYLIAAIIRAALASGKHPRSATYEVGHDLVVFFIDSAFVAWAAYLLWGQA